MEGLLGLTKSINTRESAMSDLNVLERMEQRVQHDRSAEISAQKQEQLMYERLYQTADQMLEKDRKIMNKRISMAQDQITEHLIDAGGSRKRFQEKGGMSIMGDMSNEILRSPEAVQYQENKKNLTKILELQEKGMGHLLTPKDLQSAEDYKANPNGGAITYSGVMNEIEIPPSANFDYGTDIPLEKILSYNSNMIKIRDNFKMAYPEKPLNTGNLIAFAKEMGYGGMGSNNTRIREKARSDALMAKYQNSKTTSKKAMANSFLGNWNMFISEIDPTITLKNMNELYPNGLIEGLKKSNSQTNKLVHNRSNITSLKRPLPEKGIDYTDIRNIAAKVASVGFIGADGEKSTSLERWFNHDYGLKESYRFMPLSQSMITDRILGDREKGGMGYKIENGNVIDFEPTQDMYRMDGVRLDKDNKLEKNVFKGNYKIEGVVTALKSGDVLLTDVYNNIFNNEIDKEKTAENDKGMYGKQGGDELNMTTVIALRNEETGDVFYHEIDTGRPDIAQALSNAIGEDDDIQPLVDQENRNTLLKRQLEAMSAEEEIKIRGTINVLEDNVFQDGSFEAEGKKYWGAGSAGQHNRYPMMKSFYMAFDYLNNSYKRNDEFPQGDKNVYPKQIQKDIDKGLFTLSAIHGGIEDDLKSYEQGNSNEKIISNWLSNANENAENSLEKKQNQELAQKWMQMLSLVNE